MHKQDNVPSSRKFFMDIDLRSRRSTTHILTPHIFMFTCYTVDVSDITTWGRGICINFFMEKHHPHASTHPSN